MNVTGSRQEPNPILPTGPIDSVFALTLQSRTPANTKENGLYLGSHQQVRSEGISDCEYIESPAARFAPPSIAWAGSFLSYEGIGVFGFPSRWVVMGAHDKKSLVGLILVMETTQQANQEAHVLGPPPRS